MKIRATFKPGEEIAFGFIKDFITRTFPKVKIKESHNDEVTCFYITFNGSNK